MKMKKRKLNDHKKSDHKSIINFKESFQRCEQRSNLFIGIYKGNFDNKKIMLKLKFFTILVSLWIKINHQNLMRMRKIC
jgi:hypothetical protein